MLDKILDYFHKSIFIHQFLVFGKLKKKKLIKNSLKVPSIR